MPHKTGGIKCAQKVITFNVNKAQKARTEEE